MNLFRKSKTDKKMETITLLKGDLSVDTYYGILNINCKSKSELRDIFTKEIRVTNNAEQEINKIIIEYNGDTVYVRYINPAVHTKLGDEVVINIDTGFTDSTLKNWIKAF